ncbi:hypothetical protein FJV76_30385 [Mesorhizobium sp. WSM4303]|uniref:hypothetical protein n=1 Tax=unclassified Mesorhizobium TaxID=325217 RepID=UPI00115CDD66|nr:MULTISPECIES: hypothetical protein [unclassified Mesorhizobium]TRC89347.1 hypothetical protein FJV77_29685 [Mesorhizobium sp. WSM4306]TRC94611.1 hypothetical protein FJV76_30385 [Mesorhizobium sp. WSM4303]
MDNYSDVVPRLVDWAVIRPLSILMLSATWPLMLLLDKGRLLVYGALAIFIGAGALIVFGIESPAGAAVVVLAYSLLVSVALLSTRKRLARIESRLESVISALDDLEVAEERWQTYNAKRALRRRKSAAKPMAQIVSTGASQSLERDTQVIAGPPWRELQAPDPRVGLAIPASAQPAVPDGLPEKRQAGLISS